MKLRKFLVKAKISTYASEKEADERILEDECRELTFHDGEFEYRDRYYGFNPFVGEEIVRPNNKIIWSMNYFGGISSAVVSEKEIYEFLQSSMRQIKEDRPFRGPDNVRSGNFEYIDKSIGNLDNFTGTERILFKGQEIYKLDYHGGSM